MLEVFFTIMHTRLAHISVLRQIYIAHETGLFTFWAPLMRNRKTHFSTTGRASDRLVGVFYVLWGIPRMMSVIDSGWIVGHNIKWFGFSVCMCEKRKMIKNAKPGRRKPENEHLHWIDTTESSGLFLNPYMTGRLVHPGKFDKSLMSLVTRTSVFRICD